MEAEIYKLLDTSIKIGLGALIAGFFSYFLSVRSHKNDLKKEVIKNRKELVKDLAFKLESIEGQTNEVALYFSSGDLAKAKEAVVPATHNAYAARALANLVGNDELVSSIEKIAKGVEDIFHILSMEKPNIELLNDLFSELKESKIAVYPHIRNSYKVSSGQDI